MREEAAVAAVLLYLPVISCQRLPAVTGNGVLFVPTGALMSKVSFYEGNSVPGIAQGVVLEWEEGEVEQTC